MEEIWKDIPRYEGVYQVSTFGRVKRLAKEIVQKNGVILHVKEQILKLCKRPNGYIFIGLWKDQKQITPGVHQLVAQTFIPNPNNYSCINHKDENKENNMVNNLEWCTQKYNSNYGTSSKRISKSRIGLKNPGCKKVKCLETGEIFPMIIMAGKAKNINHNKISKSCKTGKSVKGLTWKYI